MKKQQYGLLMEFIDESKTFCHGFECGLIWNKLENGSRLLEHMVHSENSAQIQMICDYFNIKCWIEVISDYNEWALLTTHNNDRTIDL